jgi:hypothetical protein
VIAPAQHKSGFRLEFTDQAKSNLSDLESSAALKIQAKAVKKALGFLENNPKHQGLHTHKYSSLTGINGEEVFEAYAQNKTPGAYRIFWHYGPSQGIITIIAITQHP